MKRERPTRRQVIGAAAALVGGASLSRAARAAVPAPAAFPPVPLRGVNLAGAEFGNLLGQHGREYLYPPPANIDYYRGLGFNVVRLPFKWERLQPELNAPFADPELKLLADCVRHILASGMYVVLDPHNYAKRRLAAEGWKTEHLIGSREVPAAAFAEFWARLAKAFAFDDRIIFGLMNEPTGIAAEAWLGIVNPTLAAIRQTGAANLVLVPGVEYTGAHSWLRVGNQAMARVVDPGARFAFEVHQYFDGNSSGTHPDAVSATIGSERIKDFQLWARRSGFRAFLGEFNGGRNPTSYKALDDICREMNANQDVWLGWAAWAGGPRWPPDDMFNLEPWPDGRMREQTAILRRYAVGG